MRGDMGGEMTPEPKIIYVSGPMTGYDEFNVEAFQHARDYIEQVHGQIAVIPGDGETYTDEEMATWTPAPEHLEKWLRQDVQAILSVDEVWVLPGWEDSRGSRFEVLIAQELGIPLRTLDGNTLYQYIVTRAQ